MLRKRLVRQSLARLFFPLLLVLSLSPCVAHAAPGDLDPSFGIGGKVITDGGVASAVAVQADGKIVAAGIFDSGEIGLVRYNTDGSVDASFGTGGRVATGILDSTDEPVLVIQPDGKAVVAGTTPNPISRRGDFVLARYNPDSTPDQGFGTGGKVITNFAFDNFGLDSDEGAHALALQADGKLVAAGFTRFINRDPKFAVARYNLDGSLDQAFGPGTVITTVQANNQGRAVIIQPNGKIVVGGIAFTGLSGGFTLVRYNPDGSLDQTFGTGGAVVTPNSGDLAALVLQPDNKLVAAGLVLATVGTGTDIALARYNPDGTLDQTFGTGGTVVTHFSSPSGAPVFAMARALAFQADGKLVAAGVASPFAAGAFALIRYNADGSLDQSFGQGGTVVTDFGFLTVAFALAVQADGKLVSAGAGSVIGGSSHKFALARYEGGPPQPPRPTGLTAVVGDARVHLSWEPSLSPVDGYNAHVARFDGTAFIPLGTVNPIGELIKNTALRVSAFASGTFPQNGELYRFTIAAVRSGIEGEASQPVFARPGGFAVGPTPPHPVLFLHGINVNAATWDNTVDFLRNTLKWRFGGELFTPEFDPTGDFFTSSFGDPLANYPMVLCAERCGILRQADELSAFILTLRRHGVTKALSLVAHSMGGLAARAYLEGHPDRARNQVFELVTYGTPHRGVDLEELRMIRSRLAQLACLACGVVVFDLDAILRSRGAEDMDANCGGTPSAFLQMLRPQTLPTNVRYTSITGHNHRLASLGLAEPHSNCLAAADGIQHADGIVPVVSADLSRAGVSNVRVLETTKFHFGEQTSDFSTILCALTGQCLQVTVHSPVDVEITTPDGRRMTRELSEIPGAAYMELKEEFGHTRATVEIPFPSKGVYAIKVIPKEDALPSDTFTLELRQGEMIAALIEDQKVSEIPQTPLLLSVAPVDIRPDATENIVNLRSQGVLPVAILSTQLFDATDVDVTTVRFGPGGAVEAHGRGHLEDVNGDGKVDLVLHFRVQETGLPSGATEACLVGRTLNGVPIMGCDSVKTLPSR